ncbi:hypothetical protein B566_EDAN002708, partial [Ephemera danica]
MAATMSRVITTLVLLVILHHTTAQVNKTPVECKTFPPTPANSIVQYFGGASGVMICKTGFKLPNGEDALTLACRNQEWVPESGYSSIPDCLEPCNPRCTISQKCYLSQNECHCPDGFKGETCKTVVTCPANESHKGCADSCKVSCRAQAQGETCKNKCFDGCVCGEGKARNDKNECVPVEKCPCYVNGVEIPDGYQNENINGDQVEICMCSKQQWKCELLGKGRASIFGERGNVAMFDGTMTTYNSRCKYCVLKDDDFSIVTDDVETELLKHSRSLQINMPGMMVRLLPNKRVTVNGETIKDLPYQHLRIKIWHASSVYILARLWNGVEIQWDGETRANVYVPPTFYNETKGLFGNYNIINSEQRLTADGKITESLRDFVDSWRTDESEQCRAQLNNSADDMCTWDLISNDTKNFCIASMNKSPFSVPKCQAGQMYHFCRDSCSHDCRSLAINPKCVTECVEGCNCPEGQSLDNNKQCIPSNKCPCMINNNVHDIGASSATCKGVGESMYSTFDGRSFLFQGRCTYTAVQHNDFSIEVTNRPWYLMGTYGSIADSITIRISGKKIQLGLDSELKIDNNVAKLPWELTGFLRVRKISEHNVIAELFNGVVVTWNAMEKSFEVNLPGLLFGTVKGLCGTFNGDQNDDFQTPSNKVVESKEEFAKSWQLTTTDSCDVIPRKPCDVNPKLATYAQNVCLAQTTFEACITFVPNSYQYYEACVNDVCSLGNNTAACPHFASYGRECIQRNISIDWRKDHEQCRIPCPGGQVYQLCGDSCTRSCRNIALNSDCKTHTCGGGRWSCSTLPPATCTGSGDPHYTTFDRNYYHFQGLCNYYLLWHHEFTIQAQNIACGRGCCFGMELDLHLMDIIRSSSQYLGLCGTYNMNPRDDFLTSSGDITTSEITFGDSWRAQRSCNGTDITTHPCDANPTQRSFAERKSHTKINCTSGQVFEVCGNSCTRTCSDLARTTSCRQSCVEGCRCPAGTVLDKNNKCVQPFQCSACISGVWSCRNQDGSRCSVVLETHYETFDKTRYDFSSSCGYVLLETGKTTVETTSRLCKTDSVIGDCPGNLIIKYNAMKITLSPENGIDFNGAKINQFPYVLREIIVSKVSTDIVSVSLPDGIRIYWNGWKRVYIDVPATFYGFTKGLCGTFDSNPSNDLQTINGKVTTNANEFALSWKVDQKCKELERNQSSCATTSSKEIAASFCKPLLETCHGVVDVRPYIESCIYDVCACQGSQNCRCTIMDTYADVCANKGVIINWKAAMDCSPVQECPIGQQYQRCGDSCTRTCRDVQQNPTCKSTCVQGCSCPRGQTLNREGVCILLERCPCLYDGKEFAFGEQILKQDGEKFEKCIASSLVQLSNGVDIYWDMRSRIYITVPPTFYGKTEGLCGTFNTVDQMRTRWGSITSNTEVFLSSWQVKQCEITTQPINRCTNDTVARKFAEQQCELLKSRIGQACGEIVDVRQHYLRCMKAACETPELPRFSICTFLASYADECAINGVIINWREFEPKCEIECPNGQTYLRNGQANIRTCQDISSSSQDSLIAMEGCFCSQGRTLSSSFGSFCTAGKWNCEPVRDGRCTNLGLAQYTTFDGVRFSCLGNCRYYLAITQHFTVEAELYACASTTKSATCAKSVTVRSDGLIIDLKQDNEILVNSQRVTQFPIKLQRILIRKATVHSVIVSLPNGGEVWWDGFNSVRIDVPPTYMDQTEA